MRAPGAAGPGLEVQRGRGLAGLSGVGPDGEGRLLGAGGLVSPEQQLELLVAEETLHQVQVQSGHGGPVHCQDLVSRPEA